MYNKYFRLTEIHRQQGDTGGSNKKIWKVKIPLKIKIFMWLMNQNTILTKDNLLKRNWQGDQHLNSVVRMRT
jgi:hypothetical protein